MMKRSSYALSPLPFVCALAVAGCSPEASDAPETSDAVAASAQSSAVRNVSVSEAKALLGSETAPQVLDVRTPEEFDAGHIEGALNVNFLADDFAQEIAKLDKSEPYLLHCKSGARSARALAEMEAQGFENIAHMTDGYDGWTAGNAGEDAAENAGA